jgi:hypothetical protein
MMATFGDVTIRPPWPDEMERLHSFLGSAFLYDSAPEIVVAVKGRVERLAGAGALTCFRFGETTMGWVSLRVEELSERPTITRELIDRILPCARSRNCAQVFLAGTVDEKSEIATQLREIGFVVDTVHDVVESTLTIAPRLAKILERLQAGRLLPEKISLVTLQPKVLPEVSAFLRENMPQSISSLAMQSAAYKPDHSIALFVDGKIKGVLLCRRFDDVGYIGLRVVAPELRGGVGWANLLLLHTYISAGLQSGLRVTRFELNPEIHRDTKQLAETMEARRIGRRVLLRMDFAGN